MMILSINLNHDGAAVLLSDGRISAYVNTERFSRIKKHPGIREADLLELLDQAAADIKDVDFVILENLGANYPELVDKYGTDFNDTRLLFTLNDAQDRVGILGREIPCKVNIEHFLCHSAASYYFSPFESALCFSYDPMGSGACLGIDNRIIPLDYPSPFIGNLYSNVSIGLGLGGLFGAGKTMGLAPYGETADPAVKAALALICQKGMSNTRISEAERQIWEMSKLQPVFVRDGETAWNATAAFLVQELLEMSLDTTLDGLFRMNSRNRLAGRPSVQPNLCLSGGTALNSVANQNCFAKSRFSQIYLHPACGDDGTAIGAALYHWHHVLGNPKISRSNREAMYSVRSYDDSIPALVQSSKARVTYRAGDDYIEETARLIAEGKIIGWFQGASEIGPRALGNRSILCDASRPEMKETLNARVKFRENFRPFAPSVLNEYAEEWFGLSDSPFMLRVADVQKGEVPAITHYDRTARIQTVESADNVNYHRLIREFHRLTGIPMVLNTSFNIKGEPVVETPGDALSSFLDADLDHLVFPGYILSKMAC